MSVIMLENSLQPIAEAVLYAAGKPVVRLFTPGRINIAFVEPDAHGRNTRRWCVLTFTRDGKRYVDPNVVMLVGLLFWPGVIAGIVAVWFQVSFGAT
jgi:hypothetical protein